MSSERRPVRGGDDPTPISKDETERWMETGRLAEIGRQSVELVHEIRTPLFGVKGLAQILQARLTRDEDRALAAQLLDQVHVLDELVSRHQGSGRRPGEERIPVELGPVAEAAAALVASSARRTGVAVDVELDGVAVVLGDPVSVQQVVLNLLQNAIDAARSRVVVRVSRSTVTVEDDGPGVHEQVRDSLFEPFVSTKPPGKGTGLGLPVSKRLVESLGGTLTWKSGPAGTQFVATFPELGAESPARETGGRDASG